jgi:hypothetical protein
MEAEAAMAEIENAAVHERAKALAARDGFAWEFGFAVPVPRSSRSVR